MFLVTIDERNGEFEYTHHMLVPSLIDFVDTQALEDFYGEGSVYGGGEVDEAPKGFYWVWGELLARVRSTQPLTEDEAATLMKFLFGSMGQLLVGRKGDGE